MATMIVISPEKLDLIITKHKVGYELYGYMAHDEKFDEFKKTKMYDLLVKINKTIDNLREDIVKSEV